jgi:hypothetical protein
LKKSINQLITNTTFLSTTLNRDLASIFFVGVPDPSQNLISVLLQIEADKKLNTRAFANISQYSSFLAEIEILFMVGSTFRIRDIYQNYGEYFYTLDLVLCSEEDLQLEQTIHSFRSQLQTNRSFTVTTFPNLMDRITQRKQHELCQ